MSRQRGESSDSKQQEAGYDCEQAYWDYLQFVSANFGGASQYHQ